MTARALDAARASISRPKSMSAGDDAPQAAKTRPRPQKKASRAAEPPAAPSPVLCSVSARPARSAPRPIGPPGLDGKPRQIPFARRRRAPPPSCATLLADATTPRHAARPPSLRLRHGRAADRRAQGAPPQRLPLCARLPHAVVRVCPRAAASHAADPPPRNDNDMYHHMNNSVYNFLCACPALFFAWLTASRQLRLGRQRLPHRPLRPAPANVGAAPARRPHVDRLLRAARVPGRRRRRRPRRPPRPRQRRLRRRRLRAPPRARACRPPRRRPLRPRLCRARHRPPPPRRHGPRAAPRARAPARRRRPRPQPHLTPAASGPKRPPPPPPPQNIEAAAATRTAPAVCGACAWPVPEYQSKANLHPHAHAHAPHAHAHPPPHTNLSRGWLDSLAQPPRPAPARH